MQLWIILVAAETYLMQGKIMVLEADDFFRKVS